MLGMEVHPISGNV